MPTPLHTRTSIAATFTIAKIKNIGHIIFQRPNIPVIYVLIGKYLSGIRAKVLDNFRKILIDRIKCQISLLAPLNSFLKHISHAAGPQNQLISVLFPITKIL